MHVEICPVARPRPTHLSHERFQFHPLPDLGKFSASPALRVVVGANTHTAPMARNGPHKPGGQGDAEGDAALTLAVPPVEEKHVGADVALGAHHYGRRLLTADLRRRERTALVLDCARRLSVQVKKNR